MGRHADAEAHWANAAAGFESALGPDHANTIGAKAAVARAMVARGAAAEARPLVERVATNPPAGLSAPRRMQTVLVYARILAAVGDSAQSMAQFDAAWNLAGEDPAQQSAVIEQVLLALDADAAGSWASKDQRRTARMRFGGSGAASPNL